VIGITADTNIYVSAFAFAGLSYQLLQAAEDRRIFLSISEPICQELSHVLQVKFAWSADEVDETMGLKDLYGRVSRGL
jgi:predicted nucleic acid-binding protein